MILRILKSAASYHKGDTVNVSGRIAADLISKGIAEEVKGLENAKNKKATDALLVAKSRTKNNNQ